jgi:hypothetical protein
MLSSTKKLQLQHTKQAYRKGGWRKALARGRWMDAAETSQATPSMGLRAAGGNQNGCDACNR